MYRVSQDPEYFLDTAPRHDVDRGVYIDVFLVDAEHNVFCTEAVHVEDGESRGVALPGDGVRFARNAGRPLLVPRVVSTPEIVGALWEALGDTTLLTDRAELDAWLQRHGLLPPEV